jgi:hypothetical protein
MAFAIILFAEAAGATTWSPATYSLGVGAFSPTSQETGSDKNFVQLSGYGLLGSRTVPTPPAAQQGSGGEVVSTSSAAPVQLGSVGLASLQPAASGTLQLSGYHGNMGGYTNIFYPSFMLGGSFGSAGGGGCGCG